MGLVFMGIPEDGRWQGCRMSCIKSISTQESDMSFGCKSRRSDCQDTCARWGKRRWNQPLKAADSKSKKVGNGPWQVRATTSWTGLGSRTTGKVRQLTRSSDRVPNTSGLANVWKQRFVWEIASDVTSVQSVFEGERWMRERNKKPTVQTTTTKQRGGNKWE